jgi:DNA-binding PucR family transcriptional regulator
LLSSVEQLATQLTEQIHDRIPAVGEDAALAGETAASVLANVTLALELMRDGQLPDDSIVLPPAALAQIRQYVQTGGDLSALLRSYRIGHEAFWVAWIAALDQRIKDPGELAGAVSLSVQFTFAYIDAMSNQVVEVFTRQRERWIRTAAASRADAARAVLSGSLTEPSVASHRLRYEVERPHVAFVVWADATDDDVLGVLEERATRLAGRLGARRSLLVPLDRLCVAGWISVAGLEQVDEVELPSVRAAVSALAHGLDGFRASHLQALQARRVAELAAAPLGSITWFDEVALVALTTQDRALAEWFVSRELGPLAKDDQASERLASTLSVYLDEGSSPVRAARRLTVHENTVTYRIRQVEQLIGHEIDSRRVELGLALRMRAALAGGE